MRRSNPGLHAPRPQPPASDAGDSSPICILPRSHAPGQARRSGWPPGTSSGVNTCQACGSSSTALLAGFPHPAGLRGVVPWRIRSPSSSGVYSSLGADLVGSVARHSGCNRRAKAMQRQPRQAWRPHLQIRTTALPASTRLQIHHPPCFPGVGVSSSPDAVSSRSTAAAPPSFQQLAVVHMAVVELRGRRPRPGWASRLCGHAACLSTATIYVKYYFFLLALSIQILQK
ncbi:hypothetical protein PVAP13_8KG303500 [Panicum virgatum]|uniref:Uncharacterized protein n=1 Tax=Panicum virgatum TaxID=38727 RepID=A0A8T0PRI4_PANVG|nr:hypothetical protein PVAP13_8KG303500 [Panicum virgatum]